MEGWIKLHRKLLENPIVCKDGEHLAIWVYLLLNATHAAHPAVFNGKKIMLQPGQLITGRKSISEILNCSESKVTRVLKSFEIEQQIEQQTCTKNRLISIVSWHKYQLGEQQTEQQLNNNRTTTEQQLNTNKNVRTEEGKETSKKSCRFTPPTLSEIESYITEKGMNVDGKKFFDYFTVGNWIDVKGNKVKNWKQKLITWNSKSSGQAQPPTPRAGDQVKQKYERPALDGSIFEGRTGDA